MSMQGGLATQLAQSMQSGQSPMNISTPGGPMQQQGLQAPSPTPMPDKSPMTMINPPQGMQVPTNPQSPAQATGQDVTLPIQDANPQQAGVQIPASESELILKALDHRLKTLSKIHSMAATSAFPQPEPQSPSQSGASA